MIFHITSRAVWEAALGAGIYEADSLKSEGFIHCSTAEQYIWVANQRFRGRADLVLLHIDPARIAVFGASAGGGLSAATALLARDRGGPELCFQYLAIPELDDRLQTVSMQTFIDTPMWNRPNAVTSWEMYLGPDHDGDVSPYASPPVATDLRGLPPAYVTTMEFDPLRDEGIIYAMRLMEAGVCVELHSYPGTFHGSSLVPGSAVSKRGNEELMVALRRGLRVDDA